MYFKDKSNTNIDSEFNSNKFDINKYKMPLIILGIIVILVIGIIILVNTGLFKKETNYFLTLEGEELITIYKGNEYVEPGYSGRDSSGNDLTEEVVIFSNIDTSIAGDYEVIYTLNDKILTRYVSVVDKPVGATSIYLIGDLTMYMDINSEYVEPGYMAIDSVDSTLTDKVIVKNEIDASKVGTYYVIYSVTNSSGITIQNKRKVIVTDSEITLSLDNNNYTNKDVSIDVYVSDNYFDYLILPDGNKINNRSYTYTVSSNGEYKFTSYNKNGKESTGSITVSNIDKEKPQGTCSGSYGSGKSNISIKASDNIGISRYVIDGVSYTNSTITLNKDVSKVSITIYDKSGNTNAISCSLSKVESSTPTTPTPSPTPSPSLGIESSFKDYSGDGGYLVGYALYIPKNATKNMPLIVALPASQDSYGIVKSIYSNWKLDDIPAFIYIPKVVNYKVGSGIKAIMKQLDKIIEQYSIDKSKISATGFSSSGTYVYTMVGNYQEYFSAMVPVSSGVQYDSSIIQNNLEFFKKLPMKGYGETGGKYDASGKLCAGYTLWKPSKVMGDLFTKLGKPSDFTDLGGMCHSDVSSYVFNIDDNHDNKSDVIEWMISQ